MFKKNKWLYIENDPDLYRSNYFGMFDLVKGILMLEIIFLHCINSFVDYLSYARHLGDITKLIISPLAMLQYGSVPMLFILCGYGIRKQSVSNGIKNNFRIFLPSYAVTIIGVIIGVCINQLLIGGNFISELKYNVIPFLFAWHPGTRTYNGEIGQIGPVWFVVTYILGSIFLNVVLHQKYRLSQAITIVFGTVVGLVLCDIAMPFCLQQVLICSGFLFVGILLKENKFLEMKLSFGNVFAVYFLCAFGSYCSGFVEFGANAFARGGTDLAIAYLAGIMLLYIYQRLNVLQGIIADGIRWVGQHMLWFCCIHTITYVIVPWERLKILFHGRIILGIIVSTIISFLFALCFCLLVEATARKLMKKRYCS